MDAASGGSRYKESPEEHRKIIEEMAMNNYQIPDRNDRNNKSVG